MKNVAHQQCQSFIFFREQLLEKEKVVAISTLVM